MATVLNPVRSGADILGQLLRRQQVLTRFALALLLLLVPVLVASMIDTSRLLKKSFCGAVGV
jgi:hypothetical protein